MAQGSDGNLLFVETKAYIDKLFDRELSRRRTSAADSSWTGHVRGESASPSVAPELPYRSEAAKGRRVDIGPASRRRTSIELTAAYVSSLT
jgi:hypothetical protein